MAKTPVWEGDETHQQYLFKAHVLKHFRLHLMGKQSAAKAEDIMQALGMPSASVFQKGLAYLRAQGEPLCGCPGAGYFHATTAEELKETTKFLKHRGLGIIKVAAHMEALWKK